MSKTSLRWFHVIVLLAMLAASCAPKPLVTQTAATEPPASAVPLTEAPTEAATEPPVLVTVTATEAAQAQPSPTLITIDLSGPPMEVGSTFMYIDGSVLVAVPKGDFIMGHGGSDDPGRSRRPAGDHRRGCRAIRHADGADRAD